MASYLADALPDLLGTGLGGGTQDEIKDFDDTNKETDNTALIVGAISILALIVLLIFIIKSTDSGKK